MKFRDTRYILNDRGEPEPCPDLMKWARWFEGTHNRQLSHTRLPGDVLVSTVFLGIDHSFDGGPPVLWETMIFGGPHNGYQDRYSSREEALVGHRQALELAGVPGTGA